MGHEIVRPLKLHEFLCHEIPVVSFMACIQDHENPIKVQLMAHQNLMAFSCVFNDLIQTFDFSWAMNGEVLRGFSWPF